MSSASASGSTQSGESSFRLGDIAQLEETVSLNTINRDQQRRYITVSADVADGYNVTKVTSAAEKVIGQAVDLPQGITAAVPGARTRPSWTPSGQLLLMLLLGIVLVYLVMVAQFQSLRSPLIVMFTIPLAFTGGFLALLLAGVRAERGVPDRLRDAGGRHRQQRHRPGGLHQPAAPGGHGAAGRPSSRPASPVCGPFS